MHIRATDYGQTPRSQVFVVIANTGARSSLTLQSVALAGIQKMSAPYTRREI